MVSYSAKLDSRTKQHTQFGVSASNGSRDMGRTKLWRKKQTKRNNNEANWMVSNSAQLNRRTKQHTQFGDSASNGSRVIAQTKVAEKKKRKEKKMNVDKTIKHPLRGSLTRQVLGRPVCDQGAIPRPLVQSNVVRSRQIIFINEEISKANWMVSNSAKQDRFSVAPYATEERSPEEENL